MSDKENPHIKKLKHDAEHDPAKFTREQLKAYVERAERLHEERKSLANDVRDIFAEAKAHGYSTRAMKHVIKIRAYDREHGADARRSEEAIVDTYLTALGIT